MSRPDDARPVQARKGEHLELAARDDVDRSTAGTWADIQLLHEALPELDLDDVDLSVAFLGRRLEAPLLIAGMTGGHPAAHQINAALAAGAARYGLALGLGSQRAALLDPAPRDDLLGSTRGCSVGIHPRQRRHRAAPAPDARARRFPWHSCRPPSTWCERTLWRFTSTSSRRASRPRAIAGPTAHFRRSPRSRPRWRFPWS